MGMGKEYGSSTDNGASLGIHSTQGSGEPPGSSHPPTGPPHPGPEPGVYQWCTRSVLLVVLEVVPPEEETSLRPLSLARTLLSPSADAAKCLAQFVHAQGQGQGPGGSHEVASGGAAAASGVGFAGAAGVAGGGAPTADLPWAVRQRLLEEAFPGAKVAVTSVVSGRGPCGPIS